MCEQSFEVVGLDDQRTAYEVEEFLSGIPDVQRANADFLNNEVFVKYDEGKLQQDDILDHIEHAGCKPSERITGVIDHIKTKLGTM